MAVGKGHVPSVLVAFDGQSLNILPGPTTGGYPATVMASFPNYAWLPGQAGGPEIAIGGTSWTKLSATAAKRVDVHANSATRTILSLVGGTSDIALENDPGINLWGDMADYADARRAAGWDKIIATTTTPSSGMGSLCYVAAGSDGVNLAAGAFLAGTGVLNVNDTTNANGLGSWASVGTIAVYTTEGFCTLSYTGTTSTSFTGCAWSSGIGATSTIQTNYMVGRVSQGIGRLIDGNARIRTDVTFFDYVVNFNADTRLCDPTNTTYFSDGVHWTAAGAAVGASLVVPYVTLAAA